MAVRALEQEGLDEPESPEPLRDAPALSPPPDSDIEVLGTLVVERVAEIAALRHALAEQAELISELRAEVDIWRTRALDEAALRKVEAARAHRNERELVSEIHRRMIEIDVLAAELAWRRMRWWRRVGRAAPAMRDATAASAPR